MQTRLNIINRIFRLDLLYNSWHVQRISIIVESLLAVIYLLNIKYSTTNR